MGGSRGRIRRPLSPVRAVLAAPALLAILAGGPSAAQAPAPATPLAAPSPAACELHVWPAATTHTTFQGWIRAGQVDATRRGVKGYPDLGANALDLVQQVRLLKTIDWRAAFGDPALVVVVHDAPTGSDDDRTRTSRLVATGSAPCYRELIIASSIVEAEVFSKQSVRILALRKRFEGAGAAPVSFSSMSMAPIEIPEADNKDGQARARMDAAVQAAFVEAVEKFAVMQSFH